MNTYNLNALIGWARRAGGDKLNRQRDSLVTDGTASLVLNNDGNIIVTTILLAAEPVASTDYELDGNVITFDDAPPDQTTAVVSYTQSTYTDEEVLNFLVDSTRSVNGDLVLGLTIAPSGVVTDPSDAIITSTDVLDASIENLIAIKAGILLREDVANSAAGDAIMIRDGDTVIDTAKTAAGNENALKRMKDNYRDSLRITIINRTNGAATDENGDVI